MSQSPGRNAPCPCGSGKRYKHCCGAAGSAPVLPDASTAPQPGEESEAQINWWLAEAVQSYQSFDFRKAASLCERALGSAAASGVQKLAAGEIGGAALTRLNEHQRAREFYLAALELNPERAETLHNLSLNAVHLGDFALAIEYSQRLLSIDPGNTDAYNNMANALRELGG